jgi:hypothetical protein
MSKQNKLGFLLKILFFKMGSVILKKRIAVGNNPYFFIVL